MKGRSFISTMTFSLTIAVLIGLQSFLPAEGQSGRIVATVLLLDGDPVILNTHSSGRLFLQKGSVERSISYGEIQKIEFDRALGTNWNERPIITMKGGKPFKLGEGEIVMSFAGTGAIFRGRDKDGLEASVPIRKMKSIEFREQK